MTCALTDNRQTTLSPKYPHNHKLQQPPSSKKMMHSIQTRYNKLYHYIYKIIKNNRRKFSFLVCFLRSNGGLSRRRSATAKFRYTFYGRSTPASFVDAISPLRRPPTAGAAAAPMADPFPPPVVLSPLVAIVANHSRLKYLIFGGDPLI